MESEFIKWAVAQGVGVILAVVVGYFYRQDHAALIVLQRETTQALVANTAALTKLTAAVEHRQEPAVSTSAAAGGAQ